MQKENRKKVRKKMSLTSFLKIKDVKEKFASEFEKPRIKLDWEIKAPPMTAHYALVGTAFDYLLRFYLERLNPKAITKRWVALNSYYILATGLKNPAEIEDPTQLEVWKKDFEYLEDLINEADSNLHSIELAVKAADIIRKSKKDHSNYIQSGKMNDELLKSTILLAQLDPIYRAGYVDRNIGIIDKKDIADLRNLISIIPTNDLRAKSTCLLNPTFGEASRLVSGADADLLIDDRLLDIKTTKKCEITRDMFNQIIGYYILGKIGGIGEEHLDISTVNEIGIYFSRFGKNYLFKVDEIIDEDKLLPFIDWFKHRAQRAFTANDLKKERVKRYE